MTNTPQALLDDEKLIQEWVKQLNTGKGNVTLTEKATTKLSELFTRILTQHAALKADNKALRSLLEQSRALANGQTMRGDEFRERADKAVADNAALREAADKLASSAECFAFIGDGVRENARDKRWLEYPFFYAGTNDDPQKWTITGQGFDNIARNLTTYRALRGEK